MRLSQASLALAALQTVTSHSLFTTFFVNDLNQGDGTCIRMPMNSSASTSPIIDLSSNDMACGLDGEFGVARVCPVTNGAKVTFLWREWADGSQAGSINISHKGPCSVYMKAVTSAITDVGYGDGWFKIWDEGYDSKTAQWCTEKLVAANGLFSVNIPTDLSSGYYLVRPELLSLQEADKSPPQPQFYTGCAQVFLQTSGTAIPENTVSIPGYVSAGDSSVTFNIYAPQFPYLVPGPVMYKSTNKTEANILRGPSIQTEGLKPAGWCGIEVGSYRDEARCWNASQACWDQASVCYSTAPPTGSKNCHIWEAKCSTIQNTCESKTFSGPPDQGKDLNPPSTISYSIPAVRDYVPSLTTGPVSVTLIPIPGIMETGPVSLVTNTFKPSFYADPVATDFSTADGVADIHITTAYNSASIDSSAVLTVTPHSTTAAHSSSAVPTALFKVSSDATCGEEAGKTCLQSMYGDCCSQWNWCGVTSAYCGNGCQGEFGLCGNLTGGEEQMLGVEHRRHFKEHLGRVRN